MGVDLTTYRCRVGTFVPQRGAGLMLMPVFIDFSKLVKMIGVVIFIKMLLFRAGIEPNPGPTTPPTIDTKVEDQTVSLGEPWELNVPITGDGPYTVKVMKGGIELIGNHIEISYTAGCVTVKINKLLIEDSGPYRIDVSNVIGTDTCSFEMDVVGKYNFRYQYLLVEIGTKVLRKLFGCIVGYDFGQYLATNPAASSTLTSLMTGRNRKITVAQEQLLPPIKTKPVSSDFDITLLTCLLRNVCGLCPPNNLIWVNPMPTDTSVEATITRLKDCRNNLSHSGTVLFPERDLNDKWTELNDILSELNKHCGIDGITDLPKLIDAASHMDIDEEMHTHLTDIIKRWHEYDQEVKMKLMKLQDKVSVVEEKMTTVATDVSGIKIHLEETRNEEIIHKQVTGHEEKPNVDDGSDIRDKLIRIYEEDCSTLPVSPLFEDETTELLKVYQNPTMFRVYYNKEQRQEGSGHVRQEKQPKEDKKFITSYQDIFGKEGCLCKKIYITGDAGVGKTSFCKRICLLWCKSKLNDQIEGEINQRSCCDEGRTSCCTCLWCLLCKSKLNDQIEENIDNGSNDDYHDPINADVEYMSRFDFVFYVTLRDTDLIDVNAMIVDQLFFTDNDKTNDETYKRIKHILMNKDCLVILDGYDEWMPKTSGKKKYDKPTCTYSTKCVILTTCRPYKINDIRLLPNEIDHQVQITGIDLESSYDYVEYLVQNMNEANHDIKDPNKFKRDVRKCNLHELLCIPMIASHLVVLWFNRKLTEMSLAHIYSYILDMLFERAESRHVNIPQSTEGECQLPDSFAEFKYLQQHAPLLYKLSLLSFNSFFNKDELAANLVFSKQQLMSEPYNLSNEESDFLCQIGILSKNKVIGRYLERRQKLSFIHNSYMEFLAAFFICSFHKNNSFDEIDNKWTIVNDVLRYKNFFLFLTGFSSQKMNIFLKKIYQSFSCDSLVDDCWGNSIFHFDPHYFAPYYLVGIESLHRIIFRCCREVRRCNKKECRLLIEDFIFDIDSYDDNDVSDLKQLLLLNTTCIKSIHSDKYYREFDQVHCLQYLITRNLSSADYVKFTECMLQNKLSLYTVCIEGGYTLLTPELPVTSLHHLTSLSLSYVKIQHNSLCNLVKFLSENVLIENIKLSGVSCDNHWCDDSDCTLTLNLLLHTKLASLYLWDVNILCNNVNTLSLKSITLQISKRIVNLCYIDLFNCIKDSQLEHLVSGYISDYNTMQALMSTMKTLPCITLLKLCYMKLPDDAILQLHHHVTHLKIQLWEVTMSRKCFDCFIESCVNNKSEIKFELHRCDVTPIDGENHNELSEEESVECMSEYLELKSSINITLKDDDEIHFETTSCL